MPSGYRPTLLEQLISEGRGEYCKHWSTIWEGLIQNGLIGLNDKVMEEFSQHQMVSSLSLQKRNIKVGVYYQREKTVYDLLLLSGVEDDLTVWKELFKENPSPNGEWPFEHAIPGGRGLDFLRLMMMRSLLNTPIPDEWLRMVSDGSLIRENRELLSQVKKQVNEAWTAWSEGNFQEVNHIWENLMGKNVGRTIRLFDQLFMDSTFLPMLDIAWHQETQRVCLPMTHPEWLKYGLQKNWFSLEDAKVFGAEMMEVCHRHLEHACDGVSLLKSQFAEVLSDEAMAKLEQEILRSQSGVVSYSKRQTKVL
jgi:hypothetical protein